jgi:flotillin
MNLQTVVAAVGLVLVLFVFLAIWAGRYVRVGPNQALVISGRQRILPDGQKVGVRFITGGGTFVLPVIEQVAVLSLDVITIKLRRLTITTAQQGTAEIDCVAQVKIKSDEASLRILPG